MMIKMAKGYAVDARRYYGHSMDNEDKLQWISLPGAQFRFDGVSSANNKKTYMFSQVSR
ncbi:MAG: hypothetical protein GAK37_03395 [Pseudomonas sp.]|nr:MAG: hypothetical protein GAK37_03395 [Pseudomonas sp.]